MIVDENRQDENPTAQICEEAHGVHKSLRYITTKWLGRDDRSNLEKTILKPPKSKNNSSHDLIETVKLHESKIASTIQLNSNVDLEYFDDNTVPLTETSSCTKQESSSPERRRRRRALNTVKSYFEKNRSNEKFKTEHSDCSTVSIDAQEIEAILSHDANGFDESLGDATKTSEITVNEKIVEYKFGSCDNPSIKENERVEEDLDIQESESEISSDAITISKPKTSPFATTLKSTNTVLNNQIKMVSLFVGDLSPDINETELYTYFSKYPGLISVKIPMDTVKNVSLEYGYVNFDNHENANLATEGLNYTNLEGSEIRIMPSVRDKTQRENLGANLFFSNLSPNLSSRIMYDRFKAFSNILSCKYSPEKCTCFISFYEKLKAYRICKQFNQTEMDGKVISVSVHISKKERETFQCKNTLVETMGTANTFSERLKNTIMNSSQATKSPKADFGSTQYSIFMKNLPLYLDDTVIRNLVEPYGTVKSILTRKVPQKNGSWSLITMTNLDALEKAIQNLNALEIEGKQLYVTRAIPREEKDYAIKEAIAPKKKLKLLVSDIDLEKDKTMLEEWCKNSSSIKSAEFFSNSLKGEISLNKRLNGYGYIELIDENDADDLIKKISELGISSYKIKIDVATAEPSDAERYPYVMNTPVFSQPQQHKYSPGVVSFSYVDPSKMFQIANFQNFMHSNKLNYYQKLENYNKTKLKIRDQFNEEKFQQLTEKQNEVYHIMWEICARIITPVLWNGNYYDQTNSILSKSRVSSLTDHLIKFFWNNNFDDFYKFLKENQTDESEKILHSANPLLSHQINESAMYLGIIPK